MSDGVSMHDDSSAIPMRYDIVTDSLVPVTQEWVDDQPNAAVVKVSLRAFLDAWKLEHEQKP